MFGRRVLSVGFAAGVIALPACVHAQEPSAQANLATGISQARAGDFVTALVTLNDAVSQLSTRPDDSATLARAHAYRALAFIGLEQADWAKAAVLQALKADSKIVADPSEFGPRVAALFDNARRPPRNPEATGQAAEQAGRFQDAFLAYLSAVQSLPEPPAPADDQRLREKIIKVVQKLETKPAVPAAARDHLLKAEALVKSGADASADAAADQKAADELRKAIRMAPWWPDAAVSLATVLQRIGPLDEALLNLSLYQLADPEGYAAWLKRDTPKSVESSETTEPVEPTSPAPAVIYVYWLRKGALPGATPKLQCDGQRVADLEGGRFIVLNASPGSHTFSLAFAKVSASFAAGQEQYVRVSVEGTWFPHIVMRLAAPDEASAEIREQGITQNDPANTFSGDCKPVSPTERKGMGRD